MGEHTETVVDAESVTFRDIASFKDGRRGLLQLISALGIIVVTMVTSAIFYAASKNFGSAFCLGLVVALLTFAAAALAYNVFMAEMDRLHETIKVYR